MQGIKAVQLKYQPPKEIIDLLKTFKNTLNEAKRIGLEKEIKSSFSLITEAYQCFKERYGLHTHYILNACEVAFSVIKKRRK